MGKKLSQSLIYSNESDIYFDPNFCQILDSHIQWLKTAGSVMERTIDIKYIGQYIGDFYNALNDAGVSPKYHRVVMLVNGLTSPLDYVGQFTTYIMPDVTKIDGILASYNTGKRKLSLDKQSE